MPAVLLLKVLEPNYSDSKSICKLNSPRSICWGWVKIFDTVVLIYRHRDIIAYSEKLLKII